MAMIACPECGKEISDTAVSCPYCGHPLKTLSQNVKKHKTTLVKAGVVAAIVLAVAVAVFIGFNSLDEHEQLALENCKALKSMLKTPSSFILYDDILVKQGEDTSDLNKNGSREDTITYMYIPYGGTNSYGVLLQDIAVFVDSQYFGNISDTESDFSSSKEYDRFLMAGLPYQFSIAQSIATGEANDFEEFIHIDSQKIAKRLSK